MPIVFTFRYFRPNRRSLFCLVHSTAAQRRIAITVYLFTRGKRAVYDAEVQMKTNRGALLDSHWYTRVCALCAVRGGCTWKWVRIRLPLAFVLACRSGCHRIVPKNSTTVLWFLSKFQLPVNRRSNSFVAFLCILFVCVWNHFSTFTNWIRCILEIVPFEGPASHENKLNLFSFRKWNLKEKEELKADWFRDKVFGEFFSVFDFHQITDTLIPALRGIEFTESLKCKEIKFDAHRQFGERGECASDIEQLDTGSTHFNCFYCAFRALTQPVSGCMYSVCVLVRVCGRKWDLSDAPSLAEFASD